ncbi:Hypothetical predicted protein [Paramuricea clavata]|uniref:Uncharacterized protein n=1 Tax=Paramuricea clavata TaxID=317549 RepID=A0A7D9MJU3_PARCT|nr:Hypothetical predicted protein [Paramuricea clavata]
MYDFHYNTIKKEYGDKAKLLFTDTDSLMYEIKTEDVYRDFKRIAHNKKVIGKFKDEAEGVPITASVGLRSKMYSYTKENGKGGMTAKGVKRRIDNEDTVEVPIIEVCDSDKWTHIPEEYIECEERCESVVCESEPVVRVVVEEETVKLNNPKVEYIKPHDLFFLKVITFRRAERKLSYAKRTAQLLSFKWSNEKMTQYMSESDKPLLCEFTREELNRCREGHRPK